MTRLVIWYIDIENPFKIEVSTASKLGTENIEQFRMKAQSCGNHQTLSAKKNFVKKISQTWPIFQNDQVVLPVIWYIDIINPFKIEVGTEKLEVDRTKAKSLKNQKNLSAKKNFVKNYSQTWPICQNVRVNLPVILVY